MTMAMTLGCPRCPNKWSNKSHALQTMGFHGFPPFFMHIFPYVHSPEASGLMWIVRALTASCLGACRAWFNGEKCGVARHIGGSSWSSLLYIVIMFYNYIILHTVFSFYMFFYYHYDYIVVSIKMVIKLVDHIWSSWSLLNAIKMVSWTCGLNHAKPIPLPHSAQHFFPGQAILAVGRRKFRVSDGCRKWLPWPKYGSNSHLKIRSVTKPLYNVICTSRCQVETTPQKDS